MKSTHAYFVEKMRKALLTEWPEWQRHEQVPPHLLAQGFWLLIPAPNPDVTRGLSISTDQRRVILGFDDDHDHLAQGKKESLPGFRQRVIARIHEVMEDRLCAISWRDPEGRLRLSNSFHDTYDSPWVERGYTRRIRSWSGKLDRDVIETCTTAVDSADAQFTHR